MPADNASEGRSPDDREGRDDFGDERQPSRREGTVPFLEELFQGEDGGSASVRRSP